MLAAVAIVVAWCGPDEAPVDPERKVAPPVAEVPEDAPDLGAVPADAGALMEAWATALKPLLAGDAGATRTALWVSPRSGSTPAANPFEVLLRRAPGVDAGLRGPGHPARDEADAGTGAAEPVDAGPGCDPGPVRIALHQTAIDLVVAIDTSGSMYRTMPLVNEWLKTSLEGEFQKAGLDYQLMVLVDLEDFRDMVAFAERRRRGEKPVAWAPSDAGVNLKGNVLSNNALEVLLASARQPQDSWLARLRPGVPTHLIVVTDDEPSPRAAKTFLSELTQLAGGRLGRQDAPTFKFHALLGMATTADHWVLAPDVPPAIDKAPCGVNPGFAYQELAQKTGGLRASVCHAESLSAFTQGLLAPMRANVRCDSALPPNFPGDQVVSVRAVSFDNRATTLSRAFDRFNCEQSGTGYFVVNHQVQVCPESCRSLKELGYDAIEAVGRCP